MKSDVDGKTLDPDNEDSLPRLGLSLGWDTRDSWRFPRRGWWSELEVWRTFGRGDFWSMNLDLRRWVPIAGRQRVLLSGLASLQSGIQRIQADGAACAHPLTSVGPWSDGRASAFGVSCRPRP